MQFFILTSLSIEHREAHTVYKLHDAFHVTQQYSITSKSCCQKYFSRKYEHHYLNFLKIKIYIQNILFGVNIKKLLKIGAEEQVSGTANTKGLVLLTQRNLHRLHKGTYSANTKGCVTLTQRDV